MSKNFLPQLKFYLNVTLLNVNYLKFSTGSMVTVSFTLHMFACIMIPVTECLLCLYKIHLTRTLLTSTLNYKYNKLKILTNI